MNSTTKIGNAAAPYTSDSFGQQKQLLKSKLDQIGIKVTNEEVSKITFLSRRKFDRYDHFAKGETFEHRLINWLQINFEQQEFRTALDVIDTIEFVSEYELKDLAMRTFLKAEQTILSEKKGENTKDWNAFLDERRNLVDRDSRESLFIAIADDITFDYFRRFAFNMHKFSKDNFIEYYKVPPTSIPELPDFKRIFLIDQLCGSGTTVIRKENMEWKGKIPTFYDLWKGKLEGKKIYYSPYIISQVAEKRIIPLLQSFEEDHSEINLFLTPTNTIKVSSCLSGSQGDKIDKLRPVSKLCQKYSSKIKIDKNIKVGGDATYGFGGAGLTIVFQSNCPNNTIPILWNGDNGWYPLFPRVAHHQEVK